MKRFVNKLIKKQHSLEGLEVDSKAFRRSQQMKNLHKGLIKKHKLVEVDNKAFKRSQLIQHRHKRLLKKHKRIGLIEARRKIQKDTNRLLNAAYQAKLNIIKEARTHIADYFPEYTFDEFVIRKIRSLGCADSVTEQAIAFVTLLHNKYGDELFYTHKEQDWRISKPWTAATRSMYTMYISKQQDVVRISFNRNHKALIIYIGEGSVRFSYYDGAYYSIVRKSINLAHPEFLFGHINSLQTIDMYVLCDIFVTRTSNFFTRFD
jgi:hypothetical protein